MRKIFLLEQVYEISQYLLLTANLSVSVVDDYTYISLFSKNAKITWRSEQGQTYIKTMTDLREAVQSRYHDKFEIFSYDNTYPYFQIQELKYYTCILHSVEFYRAGRKPRTAWYCMVISKRIEEKLSYDFTAITYVTDLATSIYSSYIKALKHMQRKENDVL